MQSVKKFFSQLKNYPIVIFFFSFLVLYFFLDMTSTNKVFDEYENRKLDQKPAYSWESLKENEYTKSYEDYINDQFIFRHEWIVTKGRIESLLLKTENNGVIYGKDNYQFTKMLNINQKKLDRNIEYVSQFAQTHPDKVSVIIAPSASLILQDKIKYSAPFVNEDSITDTMFEKLSVYANVIDIRQALTQHQDEYIYYRTDHHWTTLGAYYGYEAFANQKGFTPFDINANKVVSIEDFYGTTYSKSLWHNTVSDTLSYYDLSNPMQILSLDANKQIIDTKNVLMYDKEKFETRDKYSAFLYSNNALSRIQGDGNGKILVVKDSYANCFVPFLTANYAQIDVVDLRGLKGNVEFLIQENNYDDILLVYNFQSFAGVGADPDIMWLTYNTNK